MSFVLCCTYMHKYIYIYLYNNNKNNKKCKKEQTKLGIKHPKHIHGLHQEDTVNIGYQ